MRERARSAGVASIVLLAVAITFGQEERTARPNWRLAFSDNGTGRWSDDWVLFGNPERISVTNGPDGMTFRAGDGTDANADHAILWSKRSFSGDLRVEWDYTVLDRYSSTIPPNGYCSALMLYSSGAGTFGLPTELLAWPQQARQADTSGRYFHERTRGLQLNYAFVGDPRGNRFRIRANPGYLLGTESDETDFFRPGASYHVAVEKTGAVVGVKVAELSSGREFSTTFADPLLQNYSSGRIGLRNMNRRESRYAKVRVYETR